MSSAASQRTSRFPRLGELLVVGFGGALGALARVLVDQVFSAATWALGTLVVNVLGCALLAALTVYSAHRQVPALLMLGLGTGFCGAFTTFSTVILLFTIHTLSGYLGYLLLTLGVCIFSVFGTHWLLSRVLSQRRPDEVEGQ